MTLTALRPFLLPHQEWEFDARGKNAMDYDTFALSVFQMADAWAEEITAEAYTTFMTELLVDTTEMKLMSDGSHARMWRWQSKKRLAEVEERKEMLIR